MTADGRVKLYHVTSETALAGIRETGRLSSPSYWSSLEDMADYYVEVVSDEGETPVTLTVELSDLDESLIEPDMPSIQEPIMTVVRGYRGWSRSSGEEEVWRAWERTAGTWKDSLALVGTMRYRGEVPLDVLAIEEDATSDLPLGR